MRILIGLDHDHVTSRHVTGIMVFCYYHCTYLEYTVVEVEPGIEFVSIIGSDIMLIVI